MKIINKKKKIMIPFWQSAKNKNFNFLIFLKELKIVTSDLG